MALFAFLSYAVAMATRGTGGDGDKENTSLRASQIIQYSTYAEQAILRMRFRKIEAEDICFHNDNWGHNDYYHPGCDDRSHQLFSNHADGGNIPWSRPPEGANDGSLWYFPANMCISGVGKDVVAACNSDGTGDSEDLIMILPNIDRAVCIAINKHLDVGAPNAPPPIGSSNFYGAGMPKFAGSFADGTAINSNGSDPAILRGRQQGCIEGAGTPPPGTYHYFHILLPR